MTDVKQLKYSNKYFLSLSNDLAIFKSEYVTSDGSIIND